jgi:hypothetical protein
MEQNKHNELTALGLPEALHNLSVPYTVPNGYFNDFYEKLAQNIDPQKELEALSPLLSKLGKVIPYSQPAHYNPSTKLAKVVAMPKRRSYSWGKIAIAASVAGLVAITAVTFYNRFSTSTTPDNSVVAGTSLTPKQIQELDENDLFNTIDSLDAANYLCEYGIACNNKENAASTDSDNFMTEDLDAYLSN